MQCMEYEFDMCGVSSHSINVSFVVVVVRNALSAHQSVRDFKLKREIIYGHIREQKHWIFALEFKLKRGNSIRPNGKRNLQFISNPLNTVHTFTRARARLFQLPYTHPNRILSETSLLFNLNIKFNYNMYLLYTVHFFCTCIYICFICSVDDQKWKAEKKCSAAIF